MNSNSIDVKDLDIKTLSAIDTNEALDAIDAYLLVNPRSRDELLLMMCENNNLHGVKHLVSRGADPNKGIQRACEYSRYSIVEFFINAVCCSADAIGRSLVYVCRKGYYKIAKLLLTRNIAVKVINDALYIACRTNHFDVVKMLIQHGATNLDEGLSEACDFKYKGITKMLLRYGATLRHRLSYCSYKKVAYLLNMCHELQYNDNFICEQTKVFGLTLSKGMIKVNEIEQSRNERINDVSVIINDITQKCGVIDWAHRDMMTIIGSYIEYRG